MFAPPTYLQQPNRTGSIVVRDSSTLTVVSNLDGIVGGVTHVVLSEDGRFLAATGGGDDRVLLVWDAVTWERVYVARLTEAASFVCWSPVASEVQAASKRHPLYTLFVGVSEHINTVTLSYSVARLGYAATAMDATGSTFSRRFTCAAVVPAAAGSACERVLAGTAAGELAIYSHIGGGRLIFKTAFHAAARGVHSLTILPIPLHTGPSAGRVASIGLCAVLGGGDGDVTLVHEVAAGVTGGGSDACGEWRSLASTRLQGCIVAIVVDHTARRGSGALPQTVASADDVVGEVIAATPGTLVRVSFRVNPGGRINAHVTTLEDGSAAPLTAVTFAVGASDVIASVASDGEVSLWTVTGHASRTWRSHAGATLDVDAPGAAIFADCSGDQRRGERFMGTIYVGSVGGTLRAFEARGEPSHLESVTWRVTAHRGAITAIAGAPGCSHVFTGGADGRVCVWSRSTRALVHAFSEHGGAPVRGLALDVNGSVPLVHSIAGDRTIITYGVASNKCRRLRARGLAVELAPVSGTSAAGSLAWASTPAPLSSDVVPSFTSLTQWTAAGSECELLVGTSDGVVLAFDPETAGGAVASFSLRVHLSSGNQVDGALLPRAKPTDYPAGQSKDYPAGQSKDYPACQSKEPRDMRVLAVRACPRGTHVAVLTGDGHLAVLAPPSSSTSAAACADGRTPGASTRALALGAFRVVAACRPPSRLVTLSWSGDGRQIAAADATGALVLFNWYG